MYLSPPVWFACTLTATCIGWYMCHNFNTIFHQRILQSEGMKLIQDTARFAQYCRWDDDIIIIVQDDSLEVSIMNLFTMEARSALSLSHLPKNWIIFLRDTLIKKTDRDFVVNMLQFKQCVERHFHHHERSMSPPVKPHRPFIHDFMGNMSTMDIFTYMFVGMNPLAEIYDTYQQQLIDLTYHIEIKQAQWKRNIHTILLDINVTIRHMYFGGYMVMNLLTTIVMFVHASIGFIRHLRRRTAKNKVKTIFLGTPIHDFYHDSDSHPHTVSQHDCEE